MGPVAFLISTLTLYFPNMGTLQNKIYFTTLLIALLFASGLTTDARADRITLYAASSLKNAIDQIAIYYHNTTSKEVVGVYASSAALARQIEFGAPADIYISASSQWSDKLSKKGKIIKNSLVPLLSNRLALISRKEDKFTIRISPSMDLHTLLQGGYLSIANVDSVPAGVYGKQALRSLGVWDSVSNKLAQSDSVRGALAFVATGATRLGIVYASDLKAENRVNFVGLFPESLHDKIVYPAAIIVNKDRKAVREFFNFMQSNMSKVIFEENGFTFLPSDGSPN